MIFSQGNWSESFSYTINGDYLILQDSSIAKITSTGFFYINYYALTWRDEQLLPALGQYAMNDLKTNIQQFMVSGDTTAARSYETWYKKK